MNEKKKISKNAAAMIIVIAVMLILNAVSWLSTGITDFYASAIFAPMSDIFSMVTGSLPFSLGELMIASWIVMGVAAPFIFIPSIIRKKRRLVKGLGIFYIWVIIAVFFLETINCFMLYHTTEFSAKYHHSAGASGFTVEQLTQMCEETIEKTNELAAIVSRDDDGNMIVPDDLEKEAYKVMNKLAEEYPQLKGKYPSPKKIKASMFMTQLDLQGIYFPFSLEANINSELSPARVPCTAMHELSHLKGFIREDEAGFIAYLACLEAEEPEVRYSGYISASNYLLSACRKSLPYEEYYRLCTLISPEVRKDNTFVSEEYMEYIRQKAVISTETTKAVSNKAIDTTLKVGGITDGSKSYGRMVDLLLEYRFCIQES